LNSLNKLLEVAQIIETRANCVATFTTEKIKLLLKEQVLEKCGEKGENLT
jgi:hypothetical protein